MNTLIILSTCIFSGFLAIRADRMSDATGLRGDSEIWNTILDVAGILNVIAFIAAMVWGFINHEWWEPIAVFFLLGIVSSILVNKYTFFFFAIARPVLSIMCIGASAWLWFI